VSNETPAKILDRAENRKCEFYDSCQNEAVYTLNISKIKEIHVCADCDNDFATCDKCGFAGIHDAGYGNMSFYDGKLICFDCQKNLIKGGEYY
jgi:hypothetical protein